MAKKIKIDINDTHTSATRLDCCGIMEASGLGNDPVKTLLSIHKEILWDEGSPNTFAFIIFSDRVRRNTSKGHKLAKFISSHRLGHVKSSSVKRNNNTGRNIKMWIWETNHEAFEKWRYKYRVTGVDDSRADRDYWDGF